MTETKSELTAEAKRRLSNKRRLWRQRYEECGTDMAALVRVTYDRARAAAKAAIRDGNPDAMRELAAWLHEWSDRMETRQAERESRDAA